MAAPYRFWARTRSDAGFWTHRGRCHPLNQALGCPRRALNGLTFFRTAGALVAKTRGRVRRQEDSQHASSCSHKQVAFSLAILHRRRQRSLDCCCYCCCCCSSYCCSSCCCLSCCQSSCCPCFFSFHQRQVSRSPHHLPQPPPPPAAGAFADSAHAKPPLRCCCVGVVVFGCVC